MNVRKGTKFDLPEVLKMIQDFQKQSVTPESLKEPLDLEYLNKLYHHIILGGGICLIAERENTVLGMMLGLKNSSVWFPSQVTLNELMIFVKPEYRNSTVGGRLVKAFNSHAEEMKNNKEIVQYTISVTQPFGKLNYEKLGYKKTEEIWAVGV